MVITKKMLMLLVLTILFVTPYVHCFNSTPGTSSLLHSSLFINNEYIFIFLINKHIFLMIIVKQVLIQRQNLNNVTHQISARMGTQCATVFVRDYIIYYPVIVSLEDVVVYSIKCNLFNYHKQDIKIVINKTQLIRADFLSFFG